MREGEKERTSDVTYFTVFIWRKLISMNSCNPFPSFFIIFRERKSMYFRSRAIISITVRNAAFVGHGEEINNKRGSTN